MSITWKELQETCLRKMDSLDGVALTKDSNNAAYLYGMPAAANEALMLLATNGRYWKKLLTITQKKGAKNYKKKGGARHRGRAFGRFSCLRPAAAGGGLLLH